MIVVWCMEMRVDKNRIKFGLLLAGWSYEEGDPQVLLDQGRKVLPSEFESRMLGDIFCPVCKTSLTRSPKEKANYVNGRSACFKHLPSYSQVDCPLRVPRAEGKRYETEESAAQAIAHELLAVVSGFMKERPQPVDDQADPYDQSAVEDLEGPHSMVPIARYRESPSSCQAGSPPWQGYAEALTRITTNTMSCREPVLLGCCLQCCSVLNR